MARSSSTRPSAQSSPERACPQAGRRPLGATTTRRDNGCGRSRDRRRRVVREQRKRPSAKAEPRVRGTFTAPARTSTLASALISNQRRALGDVQYRRPRRNTLYCAIEQHRRRTDFRSRVPGSNAPHRYRIDWRRLGFVYSIDGTVASRSFATTTTMRPCQRFTAGGPAVAVDWLRMTPYPSAGTFDSRIFDAGAAADWSSLSWTAIEPGRNLGRAQLPPGQHTEPRRDMEHVPARRVFG